MEPSGHLDGTHVFFSEFQRQREAAGLNQQELATQLDCDKSTISRIEAGARVPGRDLIDKADEVLGTRGVLGRLLDDLKRQRAVPERFRPWLELERLATTIRMVQLVLVPGLLQTEGYARAVLGDDERVQLRMERQSILDALGDCVAVLDEGILTRPVAEPAVMADQMRRLAEDDRVRVHVVPAAGYHMALTGAFAMATLGTNSEAALLDNPLGGVVIESPVELALLRGVYEDYVLDALSRTQSRRLILEVAERWKTQAVS